MKPEQGHPGDDQEAVASGHGEPAGSAGSNGDAQRTLQLLRDELDGLDAALLETLRRRLDCCCRIGLHKRDHAIPMMQPHRIGVVQARAAAFAAEHGMSAPFLRSLYELMITETCRLEDEIIGVPST
ncbi:chorismate mutase [Variovorax boronicumulans]|uniref:chorismate mutase n=1 Tax=Variovorax boronicumulans TaxID=436515 RepID=A0AAW8D5B7_9BURK|nr:chorismate mutase family protein [Variovorax boronicumulans]MDP9895016.1 chorismate mutase [Variovorax boronicumulans]MDQ0038509.1 chorismate mutase [Variovorax boronicumulans]MDQ0054665.1 chorismate mutase [Variovorax boronicumulans]